MPTLESSLLYTREDGTQDFVHDSYRDFFLAKWFAEEINSGNLCVRDAYEEYWSYEEDSELWGVGGRALLPAWYNALLHVASMLEPERAEELVDVVSGDYFRFSKNNAQDRYNPFIAEFDFIFEIKRNNPHLRKKEGRSIVSQLDNSNLDYKIECLERLSKLQYYDDKISELLFDGNLGVRSAALATLKKLNHFDERIWDTLVGEPDKEWHYMLNGQAAEVIGKIGPFNQQRILTYLTNEDRNTRRFGAEALHRLGEHGKARYDEDIANALIENFLKSKDDPKRYSGTIDSTEMDDGIRGLIAIKCPGEKVAPLLESENTITKAYAAKAIGRLGYYDSRLKKLLENDQDIVRIYTIGSFMELYKHADSKLATTLKDICDKDIRKLLSDSSVNVREEAQRALEEFDIISIKELADLLKNTPKGMEKIGIESCLREKGHSEYMLQPDADPKLYERAFNVLQNLADNPAYITELIHIIPELSSANQEVAFLAMRWLDKKHKGGISKLLMENAEFKAFALNVLKNPNDVAKEWFIMFLTEIGYFDKDVKERVASCLEIDASKDDKHFYLDLIVQQEAFDYLLTAQHYDLRMSGLLTFPDVYDRIARMQRLQLYGINYPEEHIKFLAIMAHESLGMYHPNLLKLLNNPHVRNFAIEAIAKSGVYSRGLVETMDVLIQSLQYSGWDYAKNETTIKYIAQALTRLAQPRVIHDLKNVCGLESGGKIGETIKAVHQRLKPQGYNPPLKRLAA